MSSAFAGSYCNLFLDPVIIFLFIIQNKLLYGVSFWLQKLLGNIHIAEDSDILSNYNPSISNSDLVGAEA